MIEFSTHPAVTLLPNGDRAQVVTGRWDDGYIITRAGSPFELEDESVRQRLVDEFEQLRADATRSGQ